MLAREISGVRLQAEEQDAGWLIRASYAGYTKSFVVRATGEITPLRDPWVADVSVYVAMECAVDTWQEEHVAACAFERKYPPPLG